MSSDASPLPHVGASNKRVSWPIACVLMITILIMALPRIYGPSWRSIITPMDMRVVDNNQMQWEGFLMFRSMQMTMSSETPDHVRKYFSTDEYRALLPIFLAAIGTKWSGSYYWGVTISELVWWWVGSLSTMVLARRLGYNWYTATITGLLTATSPIAVAHIGAAHLHTASSMALPVATLIAWDAINNIKRVLFINIIVTGFAIFISSITYTYQWVLIPWMLGLAVVARQPRRWTLTIIGAVIAFSAFTALARATLEAGGLIVHTHLNDPIEVLVDRMCSLMTIDGLDILAFVTPLAPMIWKLLSEMVFFYHPLISGLAFLGIFQSNKLHLFWLLLATSISILQTFIYPLPWVSMSAFPLVYISSSLGIIFISLKWKLFILILLNKHYKSNRVIFWLAHPMIPMFFLTFVAMSVTNIDLIGDDTFVIQWWGSWYIYH